MSSLSAELLAAMTRQGRKVDQGSTQSVPRQEPPASNPAFRSGWSQPPRVPAPRSASPAASQTSTRSGQSSSQRTPLPRQALPSFLPNDRANSSGIAPRGRSISKTSEHSDRDGSVGSNASSAQLSMLGIRNSSAPALHHEGWLSKRSSHKMAGGAAARWQSRYWTLQGSTLCYHKQRGGAALRSFDLRRMQSIHIPPQGPMESWLGQPRELELNFGFRVWRLRAANAEDARKWLTLLDAARLVAGEPLEEDPDDTTNWDSDSASSASSMHSRASSAASGLARDSPANRVSQSASNPKGIIARRKDSSRASAPSCSSDHAGLDALCSGSGAPTNGLSRSSTPRGSPAPNGGHASPRSGSRDQAASAPSGSSVHAGSEQLRGSRAASFAADSHTSAPSDANPVVKETGCEGAGISGSAALATRARGLLPSSVQQMLPRPDSPVPDRPAPKPKPRAAQLLPASAVADRLEVDPDDLDRRFKSWLGSDGSAGGSNTPHFGDSPGVRRGLSEALAGLWVALGGDGPEGALAAWKGPQLPDPQAFADGAEGVLSEYLSRMLRRLEHWVQNCDPLADEVADVATWFLFDAMPELELFESRAQKELRSKPFRAWRSMAEQLEVLLLGEWESRSCDEIHERIEELYMPSSNTRVEAVTSHQERASAVLEILRTTLSGEIWRGHAAACDRAALVLVAALNAVLRFYRSYLQSVLGLPTNANDCPVACGAGGGRAKRRLSSVLSRLSKHGINCAVEERSTTSASASTAATTAAEAANLTRFCREAQAGRAPIAHSGICADVLLAFAGAFEREGARSCAFIAERHFAETHRQTLKEISYSRRELTQQSLVAGACEAARGFLDETIHGRSAAGAPQACDAVIRTIVQYWVRAFRRAPPRSSNTIVLSITADEAALRQLAARFGAEAMWANSLTADDPLQPLHEVRQMLSDPSPEAASLGSERLEVLLGAERGAALAAAVRSSISR